MREVTTRPEPSQEFELVLRARLNPKELGALLRKVREAVGVTQGELAKRLDIPYQNLSRLEHGAREGMLSTLNRYVRALGYELVIVARPRTGARKPTSAVGSTPERS
jgi:transcriptional regulator with XRE-family HTH domain